MRQQSKNRRKTSLPNPNQPPAEVAFLRLPMSIKTSSTNAHLQRATPKPLRKAGLHSIETSAPIYGAFETIDLARPAATPIRNSTMRGAYHCPELAPSGRPGAMDAYRLPSGGYEEQAARARVEAARERARKAALPIVPLRRVA